MRLAKKLLLSGVVLVGVFMIDLVKVHADSFDTSYKENRLFSSLKDTDLVSILPEGGFLYGQGMTTDIDGNTIYYDSQTDESAISVAEARILFSNSVEDGKDNYQINSLSTRRTSPASTVFSLNLSAKYESSAFSGSGLRFAGYLFKTTGTAGKNLTYNTYVSGGAVGSETNAWNSYDAGEPVGNSIAVTVGTPERFSGTSTYFTKNPKSGTYYTVENK
jgi:hypothetical protein